VRRTASLAVIAVIAAVALCAAGSAQVRADPSAEPVLTAPLRFHVATRDGQPVADEAFLKRQLATANAIIAPYGIQFRRAARGLLPGRHAELVSRNDRDALARYVEPGAVDVFIVAQLMDVDEPGRVRRGVHWRPRHAPEKRLVIVSAISMDDVLAHELGHYLGNQKHSDVPGNLMSYQRTEGLPVLDAAQVRRARATLAGMFEAGALRR